MTKEHWIFLGMFFPVIILFHILYATANMELILDQLKTKLVNQFDKVTLTVDAKIHDDTNEIALNSENYPAKSDEKCPFTRKRKSQFAATRNRRK